MSKNQVYFLFMALFLTGCQTNIAPSEQGEPRQEKVSEPDPKSASAELAPVINVPDMKKTTAISPEQIKSRAAKRLTLSLIAQGEDALSADRLLTPEDDNANLYFQAALGRDPGNFRAIQGIAAIVDVYTQWAWDAARSRDYIQSARYLEYARSVNPEDPVIVEMTSRVKDLKAKREHAAKVVSKKSEPKEPQVGQYFLPETLFSLSEDEIIAQIQPIIDEVAKTEQSIEIYWPNDKQARLIYQIINSRITAFRVRAMTYHRADYMVELKQD
ncbi:hypothetical protein M3I01_005030 [Marinomonas sp. RSW2]|uniref:Lipoprotein n=1 Tax=Marinomonas maritima TaxID=2940935 RepID=A0ABT5WBT9_9GAMM|nr:hypothetical protein [Marinomonas maritima]MDE8602293.1 hypothetical protein [Marinomonas maritima]